MKHLNKQQIVKALFDDAEFYHRPSCDYDTTEECYFSRRECLEALNWTPKRLLKKALKHGINFVPNEYTYTGSRTDKYCDLDIRDAVTDELIACPMEIKKSWGEAW